MVDFYFLTKRSIPRRRPLLHGPDDGVHVSLHGLGPHVQRLVAAAYHLQDAVHEKVALALDHAENDK